MPSRHERYKRTDIWRGTEGPYKMFLCLLLWEPPGNFGGASTSTASIGAPQPPTGPAEKTAELVTQPNLALIYRLSGDYNPLHVRDRGPLSSCEYSGA